MIPTSFRLMGQTITVISVPEEDWTDDDAVGLWLPQRCTILIRANLPAELRQQAFCHEAVHAILEKMGEDELNKNEKFVDLFGGLMHQMWTSCEGSDGARKKVK